MTSHTPEPCVSWVVFLLLLLLFLFCSFFCLFVLFTVLESFSECTLAIIATDGHRLWILHFIRLVVVYVVTNTDFLLFPGPAQLFVAAWNRRACKSIAFTWTCDSFKRCGAQAAFRLVIVTMPLDTILLVDTSGSMAGRGIRELKRACHTFLDGVEETAQQTGLKVYQYIRAAYCIMSASRRPSTCCVVSV